MSAREHDVVVFGATGFVGRLTAAYLAQAAPAGTRIALAGRSSERLGKAKAELGAAAADWPVVVADSSSEQDMRRLAESATVVATTVGPYLKYGVPLARACAQAGTHYADLTGEVLFMRKTIDELDAVARDSGARIVHTCGFDSIPSDLGTFSLHRHAEENGLGDLRETTFVVKAFKGGFSGGTIDSMRGLIDEAKRDPAARKAMFDPYGLSPDRDAEPDLGSERDPVGVSRDDALGGFLAPFVMGTINTRVVRRSNALLDFAYGRQMRYRELMLGGPAPLGAVKAGAFAGGGAALFAGLAAPGARQVLDRLLPKPGDGPSEQARENGFFSIAIHSETGSGQSLVATVKAPGDPGYKATAVMLGQAALCLAADGDQLPDRAGVLTPATAMGDVLVERLRAAGHTYAVAAP